MATAETPLALRTARGRSFPDGNSAGHFRAASRGDPMNHHATQTLVSQAVRDPQERERLLLEHLPQVRYIARRIHDRLPAQVPLEDLVHAGVVGLIVAATERRNSWVLAICVSGALVVALLAVSAFILLGLPRNPYNALTVLLIVPLTTLAFYVRLRQTGSQSAVGSPTRR